MEHMPRTRLYTFLFAGILITSSVGAAEVYRWVDENGEVHYSESLPPNFKENEHDVLNSSGIVVKEDLSLKPPPPKKPTEEEAKNKPQELPRDSSGLPRPKALYSEAELQRRMDNFLTLRYESEQEILDAMNVEIKQLEYDRRLLETTRQSMLDSFLGQIKQAADKQRSGLVVSEDATKEAHRLQSQLAENQSSLNALEEREISIRADFDKQLQRYRFLKEKWEKESADSSG